VPGAGVEPARAEAHGILSPSTHALRGSTSSALVLFPHVNGNPLSRTALAHTALAATDWQQEWQQAAPPRSPSLPCTPREHGGTERWGEIGAVRDMG
jgi:hypothetical protein